MATKAKPKKAVKKTAKPAKKAIPKKTKVKKGEGFACSLCGLRVTVDEACGCADVCDIMCCGEPMTPVRGKK